MGLTWAVGWELVVVLMGMITIFLPGTGLEIIFEAADDELMIVMLLPAFLGGVVFSTVLGIAGRRRRFDELSLPQFAAWGAIGGLLLGLIPAAAVAVGTSVAQAAIIIGTTTLLSAVSASRAEDRELLEASAEVAEVGLADGETQELLGGGS
jgi:drug/metabolite transporter (DMT)-like permease